MAHEAKRRGAFLAVVRLAHHLLARGDPWSSIGHAPEGAGREHAIPRGTDEMNDAIVEVKLRPAGAPAFCRDRPTLRRAHALREEGALIVEATLRAMSA